jgi:hypothetical protein
MISPDDEQYILAHAYVPEHIVGLMTGISEGEPFLIDGYVGFSKDNSVLLVGYPLAGSFDHEGFGRVIAGTITSFRPEHLWFVAPDVPASVAQLCQVRESDDYYTLALQGFEPKARLQQIVQKASRALTVERGREITRDHGELLSEFLDREKPGPRIERLFLSIAGYVASSETAVVLTARDGEGAAVALYVVELAAAQFATYVAGCHSKWRYAAGASDLLFADMVTLAREHGKSYIHLGLGVNDGIRRFKKKWGEIPRLRYEFCEYRRRDPLRFLASVHRMWG